MSGQAAFDELVAASCILGVAGKKDLNGIGEEHDDVSDEEGDRIEDEGEFAAPDWRVESRTQEQADAEREKSMKQHTCRSETGAHTV